MALSQEIARIVFNGLQQGSIYILVAIGLSIILGTIKFVNFAHGALYLIGTYAGLLVTTRLGYVGGELRQYGVTQLGLGWGFFAALLIVPPLVFVVGLLMERFIARPFYDRPETDQILLTFGIAIIVQEVFRVVFGGQSYAFEQPAWASGPMTLPVVGTFSKWRLYVIVITAMLVLLVYLLIEFTDFGLIVRAGTWDAEMVRLLGIKITRPYLLVFGIGASLAGVAGVLGGPLATVNPTIGFDTLVPSFIVVVIGGVGSVSGSVLGGVLIGMVVATLVGTGHAVWAQVAIYVLAAVILLTRPEGLLGSEGVEV